MRKSIRRVGAMMLLCGLLCGCAAQKTVTSLPSPVGTAAEDRGTLDLSAEPTAPTAVIDTTQKEIGDTVYHLEYRALALPAPLLSVTAQTVLNDIVVMGGFSADGTALSWQSLDGESGALPLPDGAEYLYALCPEKTGGFWLLFGSLPSAYRDAYGSVVISRQEPEGKLALARYDADFCPTETIALQMAYTGNNERFTQICETEDGFLILSTACLAKIDKTGAETARREAAFDEGERFLSMQELGGTLFVLMQGRYDEGSVLRAFSRDTLTLLETDPPTEEATCLGRAADARLLLGNENRVWAYDPETAEEETLFAWGELGVTNTSEQAAQTEFGFVFFTPNAAEISLLRWVEGEAEEKTVLSLAIATDDPYFGSFTAMIEDFNRSQNRYLVAYTAYADSEALSDVSELASADLLRTQIIAGDAPDLYAFYTSGYGAPPLRAEDVGADLLPLVGDEVTENSLLPNLYSLLLKDGCLYELPLTVQVDTLLGPASIFSSHGVTLSDLQAARERMPQGMVPLDSWNTPENLFSLCLSYCIGAFTDKVGGTCSFETQSFYDFLAWCKDWGGDGSTPAETERTLVKISRTNNLGQLAGRSESAEQYWFGEPNYTYIGFPTDGEDGGSGYRVLTSLAVSPQCRDVGGAKAFLEYCFSYLQEETLPANFALLQNEMQAYIDGNRTDWRGEEQLIGRADAEQFYALLASVTVLEGLDAPLAEILSEEANAYFAGSTTAEQAAKNIQSRASMYLLEQYS